jgi:hypothetical protein
MRNKNFYQNLIEKLCGLTGAAFLCLAGLFVLSAVETRADCGPPRLKNHISHYFTDPVTNEFPVGGVVFNIYADGTHQFFAYLNRDGGYPSETIFTLYINGAQVANLDQTSWDYFDTTRIARVGDLIEIYKNGAPYFSGRLTRKQYESETIDAAPYRLASQFGELCAYVFGQVWLPTSPYPNESHLEIDFYSKKPVTRMTINEPPTEPGTPGAVVAELEFITYVPQPGADFLATRGTTPGTHLLLTDTQFRYLRQGLLSYTVYTEDSPDGFINRHLRTYATNQNSDFEGDGQSDLSVYRPSERNWHLLLSSTNEHNVVRFGLATDKLVAGDYDADGKTDIAVYQVDNPNYGAQSAWQILKSSDNSVITLLWGLHSDIPLTMNYDGNSVTDIVAFRPSTGVWHIRRMGDIIKPFSEWPGNDPQEYRFIRWGMAGDKPLTADFSGDGLDELAVFRPSDGNWYIYNRVADSYQIVHWGMPGDTPIAKDFDGDSRSDLAVFRPSDGTWYILNSLDNSILIRQFGIGDDIPVPADFDKDTVTDIAVYRPSNGTWYVARSSDNTLFSTRFGRSGDIPVMAQN